MGFLPFGTKQKTSLGFNAASDKQTFKNGIKPITFRADFYRSKYENIEIISGDGNNDYFFNFNFKRWISSVPKERFKAFCQAELASSIFACFW